MATKRMFSMQIVDSDAFLEMPQSSQNLYFHLAMRADDDGFVNGPKRILKTIGASEDDLRVLLGKRFLLAFESGVVVIKHWRIHNCIQKDRKKDTKYTAELGTLLVKDNGSYTECIQNGNNVNKMETQIRLDKVRLEENRKEKKDKTAFGLYNNVRLSWDEVSKLHDEFGQHGCSQLIERLSSYKESSGKKYASDIAAIRNWVVKATGVQPLPPPATPCPHCGKQLDQGICGNAECPQWEG